MNIQYKVCVWQKISNFEKLNVFIDNEPIQSQKSKYVWCGDAGNHIVRIEQYKMMKSKYYWLFFPLVFLLSVLSGDGEFDGKTPFYAVYEAEIYIDKDIQIEVVVQDRNMSMKKSKHGFQYEIKVKFSVEPELKVIKNEFTATPQEKKRWLVFHISLWSIMFTFLTGLFIISGINSVYKIGTIFCGFLTCLSIVGWFFFINRFYKHSKGVF